MSKTLDYNFVCEALRTPSILTQKKIDLLEEQIEAREDEVERLKVFLELAKKKKEGES